MTSKVSADMKASTVFPPMQYSELVGVCLQAASAFGRRRTFAIRVSRFQSLYDAPWWGVPAN